MNEFVYRLDLDFILLYVAIFGFSDLFIRICRLTVEQEFAYYGFLFVLGLFLFIYNKFYYKRG
jgi:hypothetical protein